MLVYGRVWGRVGARLRYAALAALAAFTALLAVSCAPATQSAAPVAPDGGAGGRNTTYPLVVADGLGRQVRIERAPQRIVSYRPSNTETLFALGAGDRIVGTDDFSDFPAAAKAIPKLGGVQVNLEALVALQPDLVVTIGARPDLATLLAPYQVPVLALDYKDVAGTLDNIALLGRVVDRSAAAGALVAEMRARMERVQARTRGAHRVRVYYEVDATNPASPVTAGPGSFIDGLLTMAGGENVAATASGEYPRISAELVVSADPEVIVVPTGSFSPPDAVEPARFARRPGWAGTQAVRNGAIRGIDADIISRPGPRLPDALDDLARALHPEAF